jgi:glycosyltransferase involved in cell wall biosynthesis
MMLGLGHEVYSYGSEQGPDHCTEHVAVITPAEQQAWLGVTNGFQWDATTPYWQHTNQRIAKAIGERKRQGDFLCLVGGLCQQPIAREIGADVLAVEIGIGYYGTFAPYRVFESYTHQALVYGQQQTDPTVSLYDTVIPGYFDPDVFAPRYKRGDYLLFLGRAIARKGVDIAQETAKASGVRLIMAGPGTEYGAVPDEERNAMMAGALAVIMPTLYFECFGNVAVESQLCGTPVITTDHGAFRETVEQGVTGFRCRTLRQFVEAVSLAGGLDRERIREHAVATWGLGRAAELYQEYFQSINDLWRSGWYTLKEETH